ncbi:hypothetical protein DPSP01_011891 [Paraphaeosphaeria sporulosa]|uniref:Uncharacterized protein n=1 Tax=Paraphaeosphaeria sporulosa TaxID=1460663 RepID=A0A177D0M2_9PLEO|nr:uncharacterized protein CC84DRAFT_1212194 [Paraphaeosphaeria sporulosa]OAG12680.1 hypothetical protein CC84DRAFT_1212194 [Paraphaeosphaeria sporulosa]
MADALCGPSTALQNFQKHTSVDRTLQQDRLVGRHSPSQGFRSSLGQNNGALDHEFEAFQAGHALPSQPQFQHLPPQFARAPPPQFAQPSQAPDWASDFQRLNISQSAQIPQQRVPAQNAASSWHQDFMSQQGPAAQAPVFQQNGVGGMAGYGMSGFAHPGFHQPGFAMMNGGSMSEVAQGKQRVQDAVPQFDEAAFERAFADVQQAEEQALAENLRPQETHTEETAVDNLPQEPEDPALMRIREQRPAVYAALKIRSAVDLENASQAMPYLDMLETMETEHQLTRDASEARWVIDTLQNIASREGPQEIKTRSEQLIRNINERLMSTYPLLSAPVPINQDRIWEELEAAGYTRSSGPEQLQQPQEPEQKQEEEQHQPRHDDDEMAQTAGRLLERVSDNTSEKFQKSQFLELMRRLRDREIRVEGDKMVEVSTAQSTSSPPISAPPQSQTQLPPQPAPDPLVEHYRSISPGMDWSWSDPPSPAPVARTVIPPVDPNILDHAATDFDTPVYSGEGQEYDSLSRRESSENVTDEVSDQYSYYNVNSTYHR